MRFSSLISAVVAAATWCQAVSARTVFAHFMMDNAYAYTLDQWSKDIAAAQQIGIDGFALNWHAPDCSPDMQWTVARIDDAFKVAQQKGFKLMYSFDMSHSVCNTFWNQTFMQQMIDKHAGNSATFRWNNNILVSTYGGDSVAQYGNDFFQGLKNAMKSTNAITLAPALTGYSYSAQIDAQAAASKLVNDYPSIDGYFNWQAWPLDTPADLNVTPDRSFQSTLKKAGRPGPYIMALSPWQFKDLNDGNSMDAWVQKSDTLFASRFKQILSDPNTNSSAPFLPDIIELLTWNDFCESHYLRDLSSPLEASSDYADFGTMAQYIYGHDHSPWRLMAQYYIAWWKTGVPPPVTQDRVVFWYRVHPKNAVCSGGSSTGSAIRNYELVADAVFAWALVKKAATISLSLGNNKGWTFHADPKLGPTIGSIPFPEDLGDHAVGVKPEVAVMRNGTVVQFAQGALAVTTDCDWQNFNPVVGLAGAGLGVPI